MVHGISWCADALGKLGWRSPLRSTAMHVMSQGVVGDPGPYRDASGGSVAPLHDIYTNYACSHEHRLAARLNLLMPVIVATLCLFWTLSGVVDLIQISQASTVLTQAGWTQAAAAFSVAIWSCVDIALGVSLLWRDWAARACLAQVAVAVMYIVAATIVTPGLWIDPLGPLLKILPVMMLSLVAWSLLKVR